MEKDPGLWEDESWHQAPSGANSGAGLWICFLEMGFMKATYSQNRGPNPFPQKGQALRTL